MLEMAADAEGTHVEQVRMVMRMQLLYVMHSRLLACLVLVLGASAEHPAAFTLIRPAEA
jgi:hypothetical protein